MGNHYKTNVKYQKSSSQVALLSLLIIFGLLFYYLINNSLPIPKNPKDNIGTPTEIQISITPEPEKLDERICFEYTIYPFLNRPSDLLNSDVGVYLHSTNKEPTCEKAVINYEIDRVGNNISLNLPSASNTGNCIIHVVGAGPIVPYSRVILGRLSIGEYKININSCDNEIDEYTLQVTDKSLVIRPKNVTNGKLHPNNNGIYNFENHVN